MGRNLVLCFDKTNNQYAATSTNVVKIFTTLDCERTDQVAYYQSAIGTFAPPRVSGKLKQWFITRLDLAIALLLEDHVTDGYVGSKAGLSKIALNWMVAHAETFGLRFNSKAQAIILPAQDSPQYVAPNSTATEHQSLQAWWWIAEYFPKRMRNPQTDYKTTRWIIPTGQRRHAAEK